MSENPFIYGNPVSGHLFSGREDDIKWIIGRLKTMQSVSIVGERRIGKTSLLYYLSDRSEMERWGFNPDEYVFLNLNFEGFTNITPIQFWRRILRRLSRVCKDETISSEIQLIQGTKEIDFFDIEDLFFVLKERGLKIIFLFDEFEYIMQNPKFDLDFFGILRSLAISRDTELAIVTASRRQLAEMSHEDMVGSPFYNIFAIVFLKPLNESDAHQLIHKALAENSVSFDLKDVESLIELTGGYPYFLQMACSYLYDAYTIENLTGNENREKRFKTAKEGCVKQAKPHFEDYWHHSSDSQRILLMAMAIQDRVEPMKTRFDSDRLKRYYQEAASVVPELEARGFVLQQDHGYRIFSPMFADWVIDEIINRNPPEQDYAAWLKDKEGVFVDTEKLYQRAREISAYIAPTYWSMLTEWLSKSAYWYKVLRWLTVERTATRLEWNMFRGNPAHTGVATGKAVLKPNVKWRFKTGSDINFTGQVSLADEIAYIGSDDSHVYAIDANSGDQIWKFKTSAPVWSSPSVVDGVVYIGSEDNHVYAIDANSGDQIWKVKTDDSVRSSPCVVDGVVYIGSWDSHVYALDANSGDQIWKVKTDDWVSSSPCVVDGMVYIGSRDSHVYALDANSGDTIWKVKTDDSVSSSPCVVDGVVYIGSWDSHVYALDANSGDTVWKVKTDDVVNSSPCVVAGTVYIGSSDSHVYALDANSGDQIWKFKTDAEVWSSPCVVDWVLYIGSDDSHVYAIGE